MVAVVAQRGAAVFGVVDYVVLTLIVLVLKRVRLQHWCGNVGLSGCGNEFQLYLQKAEYLSVRNCLNILKRKQYTMKS